ncbi:DUF4378 domain protein, partial [Zea mays]
AYLEQELDRRFRLYRFWETPREEFLRAHAGAVRAVVGNASYGADAALIDALPALEIVASFSVGIDRVDLAKCRDRGIRVTNTPDVLTDDVADLAVASGGVRLPGELPPADGAAGDVPELHLLPVGGGAGGEQRRAGGGVPAERADAPHREPRGDGSARPQRRADQRRPWATRGRARDGGGAGGRAARRRRAGRVRGRA